MYTVKTYYMYTVKTYYMYTVKTYYMYTVKTYYMYTVYVSFEIKEIMFSVVKENHYQTKYFLGAIT